VEVQLQADILMGVVVGVLAWIYARREGTDCGELIRGSLGAAAVSLLIAVLLAKLVGHSLAQEFMARKSFLSLSLVLLTGACTLSILNFFMPTSGDDDA
jgi:Na+/serine symporter